MLVGCRQLEDALDHKNAELIDLRKAALEHAVASPIKPSSHLQSALGAWGNAVDPLARHQEGASSSDAGAGLIDQQGFQQTPLSAHSSHGYTTGTVIPSFLPTQAASIKSAQLSINCHKDPEAIGI